MNDVEIVSLLEDAGYRFDAANGRYVVIGGGTESAGSSEEVADQLEIPIDDLLRWEDEQREAKN
jgi:hypothetical protein